MSDSNPFWLAVQTGDTSTVSRMIDDSGSLLDQRAESGHTPVRMACDCGQRELAEMLVDLGAELDAFDACAYGDASILWSKLDDEPGLLTASSHDGWTLLHLACFTSNLELVSGLLARNASVVAVSNNPTCNTPLHAALAGGATPELLVLLFEKGADSNAIAGAGATPLHLAASRGNHEVVELLLLRGAVCNAMDNGQSPSAIARERGFPELADRLLVE